MVKERDPSRARDMTFNLAGLTCGHCSGGRLGIELAEVEPYGLVKYVRCGKCGWSNYNKYARGPF